MKLYNKSKGERHVKPFPQAKLIQYFRSNHIILFALGKLPKL